MFYGEMLCLPMFWYQQRRARARFHGVAGEMMPDSDYRGVIPVSTLPEVKSVNPFLFLIPALLDLTGTSLAGIGMLYIQPSVWQMLRGSVIIFSAILSHIFLGQRKHLFHWLGLTITFFGLATVGSSSLLNSSSSSSKGSESDTHMTGVGILFVLAGQVTASCQMIVEEKLLKQRSVPALKVVGSEGSWGALIMTVAVLPAMYFVPGHSGHGCYEDAIEAFVYIKNNVALLVFCILYIISISFFNFASLTVAKTLTSVHRTLIDASRTIFVWSSSLIIGAFLPKFGEQWGKWSPLQIAGFILLLTGSAVYNKILILPGGTRLGYEPPKVEEHALDEKLLYTSTSSINEADHHAFAPKKR